MNSTNCQINVLEARIQFAGAALLHVVLVKCPVFSTQSFPINVWTLLDHSFLSYVQNITVKMHLFTMWPWPFTSQTSRISQGHSLYMLWTLWDPSFWVMLWTNRQIDTERPTLRPYYIHTYKWFITRTMSSKMAESEARAVARWQEDNDC